MARLWTAPALVLLVTAASHAAEVAPLQPPRHVGPPQPEQVATNWAFSGIPSMAVAQGGRLWATWKDRTANGNFSSDSWVAVGR